MSRGRSLPTSLLPLLRNMQGQILLRISFDLVVLRIAEEHALLAEQEERERLAAAEGKLA